MSNKDYYKILGVSENAGIDEIKKAYRNLALKYHPDRNPGNKKEAEERFKEIGEAYYVLGNEKRRAEYDAFRKGYGYGEGGEFTGAQGFDFDEILKRFSGSARRGRARRTTFKDDIFEDIFSVFQNMGDNGVHTEYIHRGNGLGGNYSNIMEHTDINATLAIPAGVAKTGGEVLFRHDGKKITLRIKPDTRSGQKLRIRGQGKVCSSCGHAGDLIVTIK
ncbi:MAG: hypothetical protein A2Z72_07270 [Omnitrophica bacterium RBG_13_46_9]|nr:MAG: hypothetical protein A2Z72_07270 [Omnitrophica bacterium RBG_13_46_9]